MKALRKLEREEYAGPRSPAHALRIEVGHANNFQYLLTGDDRVRGVRQQPPQREGSSVRSA